MNYSNYQSDAYKETSVTTSNQIKLVVMLYEGAIRFLREAVGAIENKDIAAKAKACDRALAIVQHSISLSTWNVARRSRSIWTDSTAS